MFVRPLPVVTAFLEAFDTALLKIKPTAKLTSFQKAGLTLIIMGFSSQVSLIGTLSNGEV